MGFLISVIGFDTHNNDVLNALKESLEPLKVALALLLNIKKPDDCSSGFFMF